MPNIPCPSTPGLCADPANPFSNISSEAPDKLEFFGFNTGFGPQLPPLGSNWLAVGCLGVCTSSISQEDADLCAAQQEINCLSPVWPTTGPANPFTPPTPSGPVNGFNPTPRQIFTNTEQSCSVPCPDGSFFTFVVEAGRFSAFDQVTANNEAHSYACNQAILRVLCMAGTFPAEICLQTPASSVISASGVNHPFTFSISSGSLPPGLLMTQTSPTTAVISGTTTASGSFAFTVQARDSAGGTATKSFSTNVVGISTANALPDAQLCTVYSVTFQPDGPTQGVVTWTAIGSLPAGLTLDSATGVLSGTATEVAANTFTIAMNDANVSCHKDFTLNTLYGQPVVGFKICDLAGFLSQISMTGDASSFPAWDGVFNFQTQDSFGDTLYFFVNQSVNGIKAAANEAPDWPCNNWQDNDSLWELYGTPGNWHLFLSPIGNTATGGWVGSSFGPTPDGLYVPDFPQDGPACVCVMAADANCDDCAPCADCGDVPDNIQDVIFTQGPFNAQPPCGTVTITNGVGTFDFTQNLTTCINNSMDISGTICNPVDPYQITITIPWDDSGSVSPGIHTFNWALYFDNVLQMSVTRDLQTGPFTDVVLQGTLPGNFASTSIKINFAAVAGPSPSFSVFSLGHLNNLTITPLTHP